VTVAQQTDDEGRSRTDTVRLEMTELSHRRVDPNVFQVPVGYESVDMVQLATAVDCARRARGDTGSLGDAPQRAADGGVEENATESVKNAIGGMIKRRRP
jgi:hypothetical protein